ncbi:sensor histidine kinase [Clostridium lundense]|uniref:sensor histidine kinase n=1 Tax=Clostridium lundense TaxID=319475 RepID=UPI000485A2F0|nr:HAMP domain-containing sensor histidine kinase [Clostridium lundense]
MDSILKNPETKSIVIKLLVFQGIFAGVIYVFLNYQFNKLNENIVNQNSMIIGSILYEHPELEDSIIKYVTKEATKEQIIKGKEILKQYGYYENMKITSQPLLKNFYASFQIRYTLVFILALIPLIGIVLLEYKNIFQKVKKISNASEKVIEGDHSLILREDEEGEFAILAHNFNLMSNRLKLSLHKLKEDKIFLKNIISDISHQLKTPLTSLFTINELLLTHKEMEEEVRTDFLQKSESQLNRMEWLIINLLKIARLEAQAISFQKKNVLGITFIQKALTSLKIKSDEKHQRITVSGDVDNVYFYVDEQWTVEAVLNIIKNCIEHTKEGGEIKIHISETPLFSRISIEDNGEGIDKRDLPHIFERFYKGSNSVNAESVGIGLALTKVIIESQGGTILVNSEKSEGSKFDITFLKGII